MSSDQPTPKMRPTSLELPSFQSIDQSNNVIESPNMMTRSFDERYFTIRPSHSNSNNSDDDDDEDTLPSDSNPMSTNDESIHAIPPSPTCTPSSRKFVFVPNRMRSSEIFNNDGTLYSPSTSRPASPLISGNRRTSIAVSQLNSLRHIRTPLRRLRELQNSKEINRIEADGERSVRVSSINEARMNILNEGMECLSSEISRKRRHSLTEPIAIDVEPTHVPISSQSMTHFSSSLGASSSSSYDSSLMPRPSSTQLEQFPVSYSTTTKQCYSPATQQVVRSNIAFSPSASPAPSPTRSRQNLRSQSPIASRPLTLKRKITAEQMYSTSHFHRQNSCEDSAPTPKRLFTGEKHPPLPPSPLTASDGTRPSSRNSSCSSSMIPVAPLPMLFGLPDSSSHHRTSGNSFTLSRKLSNTSLMSTSGNDLSQHYEMNAVNISNDSSNSTLQKKDSSSDSPLMFAMGSPSATEISSPSVVITSMTALEHLTPTPMHSPARNDDNSNDPMDSSVSIIDADTLFKKLS